MLGILAILLAILYAMIRQRGEFGQLDSTQPRMNPPTLIAPVQRPESLVVGRQQRTFHGVNSCVIASINGMSFDKTVTLNPGTVIGLGGWLIDKTNQTVPKQAWIVLAGAGTLGSYQVPIVLHEKRPDVSQAFGGVAGYTNSGFIVDLTSADLSDGNYHLYIVFKSSGIYETCDNGRHIRLAHAAAQVSGGAT